MKVNEFKAVYEKTDLFAISLTPIDAEVPYNHVMSKSKSYGPVCPLGLVKGKVVETGAEWTSTEAFGCLPNSSRHVVTHKNGILVQFDPKDADKKIRGNRHVKVDGKTATIIVSAKALIMPWADYEPVQAHRKKRERDGKRRSTRIVKAMKVVGARHGDWHEYRKKGSNESTFDARRATVQMPMMLAEELGEVLALLDAEVIQTDDVTMALKRWRERAETYEERVRSKIEA